MNTRAEENTAVSKANSEVGNVIKTNVQFLVAALLSILAYELWPSRPEWWGFGILSICIGMGAIGHAIKAMQAVMISIQKNRVIGDQTTGATEAKYSRQVTRDVLQDAGMK